MLVLLILDLLAHALEHVGARSAQVLGALREKLPIGVVLRFGQDDALAGNELGADGIPRGERALDEAECWLRAAAIFRAFEQEDSSTT